MRKATMILLAAILVLSVVVACTPSTTPTAQPSPSPSATTAPTSKPTTSPTSTPTATAKPQVITLKYGTYTPPNDIRTKVDELAIKMLTDKAGGRLKFDFYPAEQLYTTNEAYDAVRKGLIDIYEIQPTIITASEPVFEMVNAPHAAGAGDWQTFQDIGFWDTIVKPAYARHNIVDLGDTWSGQQSLYFKKKVTVAEDMKGLKLRSPSSSVDKYLNLFGASAVRISSTEVYLAAQRGTIDGFSHSVTSYVAFKEWEVAPFMVEPRFGAGFNTVAMNQDAFNKLPKDLQDIVKSTMIDWQKEVDKQYVGVYAQQYKDIAAIPGVSVYFLPQAERDRWWKIMEPFWPDFIKVGGPDAPKALDLLRKFWAIQSAAGK